MRFNSNLSRRGFLSLAANAAMVGSAWATGLGIAPAKPILTVSGKIAVSNKDGAAVFDRSMLESLGTVSFKTSTPWFSNPVTFEGVPMAKLMEEVGATGERVAVVALNDYTSEVPIEDFAKHGVILALKRDGEYMPVRDKGPLFIVYPFDSNPELKSQKYYSRSVWQVKRIEVR